MAAVATGEVIAAGNGVDCRRFRSRRRCRSTDPRGGLPRKSSRYRGQQQVPRTNHRMRRPRKTAALRASQLVGSWRRRRKSRSKNSSGRYLLLPSPPLRSSPLPSSLLLSSPLLSSPLPSPPLFTAHRLPASSSGRWRSVHRSSCCPASARSIEVRPPALPPLTFVAPLCIRLAPLHPPRGSPGDFGSPRLLAHALARKGRVGRWGELVCYEYLRRSSPPSVLVEWLNEEVEQGLPYVSACHTSCACNPP